MIVGSRMSVLALVSVFFLIAIAGAYTVDMRGGDLVDERGMTLYYFVNDGPSSGISTCYGSCSVNWPPFYANYISVPGQLNANDLGSIRREDGRMQTTYKGWPLYYYSGDGSAGDTNGNGQNGLWFMMNP